jgi:hypothetical protein
MDSVENENRGRRRKEKRRSEKEGNHAKRGKLGGKEVDKWEGGQAGMEMGYRGGGGRSGAGHNAKRDTRRRE